MYSYMNKPTNKSSLFLCETNDCYPYNSKEALIPTELDSNCSFFPQSYSNCYFSSLIDYSNTNNVEYLSQRRSGIRNIRYLVNVLHYTLTVLYKAISYMDKIYLQSSMSVSLQRLKSFCKFNYFYLYCTLGI